jgi:alpha-amylase
VRHHLVPGFATLVLLLAGCSSVLIGDGGAPPLLPGRPVNELVFYEANFQTLSGSNRLQALTAQLDRIEALSVNVLWLMPIHPIGQLKGVGSPYSVRNYGGLSSTLGSSDDLKALVADAHARGIAVVLDWVANHTSWDNPWINNPGWYTQDGGGNIISPAGFNWTDVADLNYGSNAMRAAMIDSLSYWVQEFSIDGFRCDAADFVPDDFWKSAIETVEARAGRDLIWLAEGGKKSQYTAGFDLLYGWDFSNALAAVFQKTKSPTALFAVQTAEYSGIPAGKQRLRYTTNHDLAAWESSPVERFGSLEGSVAAFAVSSLAGGVPLVYGSQELGYPGTVSFFGPAVMNWSSNPEVQAQYRQILAYRETAAARTGALVDRSTASVVAFSRETAGEGLFVVANPGDQAVTVTAPDGQNVAVAGLGYAIVKYAP